MPICVMVLEGNEPSAVAEYIGECRKGHRNDLLKNKLVIRKLVMYK